MLKQMLRLCSGRLTTKTRTTTRSKIIVTRDPIKLFILKYICAQFEDDEIKMDTPHTTANENVSTFNHVVIPNKISVIKSKKSKKKSTSHNGCKSLKPCHFEYKIPETTVNTEMPVQTSKTVCDILDTVQNTISKPLSTTRQKTTHKI